MLLSSSSDCVAPALRASVLAGTLDLAGAAHPAQLHSMVFTPSCIKEKLADFYRQSDRGRQERSVPVCTVPAAIKCRYGASKPRSAAVRHGDVTTEQ